MTSLLDVRLGSQVPVIQHLPPDVHSLAAAEEAIELADAYGVCDGNPLSESQKITLRAAGGERADGSWAATRIGDFGPRQGTGKNDKIAAWELAHLLLFGTKLIIHTAHEFPTANESFLRLVAVFDAWDDLGKKVQRIRYANGEQGIELKPNPLITYQAGGSSGDDTGQRLKYRARTGGSGRGFAKAGLLIYDEAQHLHREHVAASGPAKLANPNSQTWYAGSGGLATSEKAWEMRRDAILGRGGRLGYTEMTGETITVDPDGTIRTEAPDPTDRDVWYRCIPGLGRWVTEEGVEALFDELGPELFIREILCGWDPMPDDGGDEWVIPSPQWTACADPTSVIPAESPLSFALEVAADQSWSTFAVAGTVGDKVQAEIAANQPGTGWVVEWAKSRSIAVAVRKGTQAAALIGDLRAAGVEVVEVSTEDYAKFCGQLYGRVVEGRFVHRSEGALDMSVRKAVKRAYSDAYVWDARKSSVDISPLGAVTVAVGRQSAPKINPEAVVAW